MNVVLVFGIFVYRRIGEIIFHVFSNLVKQCLLNLLQVVDLMELTVVCIG